MALLDAFKKKVYKSDADLNVLEKLLMIFMGPPTPEEIQMANPSPTPTPHLGRGPNRQPVLAATSSPTPTPEEIIEILQGVPPEYVDDIIDAADQFDVDPYVFAALLKQESSFDPAVITGKRKSTAGAQGIGQFMPATAKAMGIDPLDPKQAIPGSAKYLRQKLDEFGGDLDKALAAYNAGSGNVRKYKGVPPFPETQNYIKKIKQYAKEIGSTEF